MGFIAVIPMRVVTINASVLYILRLAIRFLENPQSCTQAQDYEDSPGLVFTHLCLAAAEGYRISRKLTRHI